MSGSGPGSNASASSAKTGLWIALGACASAATIAFAALAYTYYTKNGPPDATSPSKAKVLKSPQQMKASLLGGCSGTGGSALRLLTFFTFLRHKEPTKPYRFSAFAIPFPLKKHSLTVPIHP